MSTLHEVLRDRGIMLRQNGLRFTTLKDTEWGISSLGADDVMSALTDDPSDMRLVTTNADMAVAYYPASSRTIAVLHRSIGNIKDRRRYHAVTGLGTMAETPVGGSIFDESSQVDLLGGRVIFADESIVIGQIPSVEDYDKAYSANNGGHTPSIKIVGKGARSRHMGPKSFVESIIKGEYPHDDHFWGYHAAALVVGGQPMSGTVRRVATTLEVIDPKQATGLIDGIVSINQFSTAGKRVQNANEGPNKSVDLLPGTDFVTARRFEEFVLRGEEINPELKANLVAQLHRVVSTSERITSRQAVRPSACKSIKYSGMMEHTSVTSEMYLEEYESDLVLYYE